MRSKRMDLDGVVARFDGWRRTRRGRAIPGELWKAAVGLLGEHNSSAVCRALGLNASRFKQMREARGGLGLAGRSSRGKALPRRTTRREANGFVELPSAKAAALLGGIAGPGDRMPDDSGLRLTVEYGSGTLSVVSTAPGATWLEAVSRLVLFTLLDGSRTRSAEL